MIDGDEVRACIPKDYSWDTNAFVAKEGEAYLDECNGRVQPDGSYGYHITNTFPYWAGCYRGTATITRGGGGGGGGGGGAVAAVRLSGGCRRSADSRGDRCEFQDSKERLCVACVVKQAPV